MKASQTIKKKQIDVRINNTRKGKIRIALVIATNSDQLSMFVQTDLYNET